MDIEPPIDLDDNRSDSIPKSPSWLPESSDAQKSKITTAQLYKYRGIIQNYQQNPQTLLNIFVILRKSLSRDSLLLNLQNMIECKVHIPVIKYTHWICENISRTKQQNSNNFALAQKLIHQGLWILTNLSTGDAIMTQKLVEAGILKLASFCISLQKHKTIMKGAIELIGNLVGDQNLSIKTYFLGNTFFCDFFYTQVQFYWSNTFAQRIAWTLMNCFRNLPNLIKNSSQWSSVVLPYLPAFEKLLYLCFKQFHAHLENNRYDCNFDFCEIALRTPESAIRKVYLGLIMIICVYEQQTYKRVHKMIKMYPLQLIPKSSRRNFIAIYLNILSNDYKLGVSCILEYPGLVKYLLNNINKGKNKYSTHVSQTFLFSCQIVALLFGDGPNTFAQVQSKDSNIFLTIQGWFYMYQSEHNSEVIIQFCHIVQSLINHISDQQFVCLSKSTVIIRFSCVISNFFQSYFKKSMNLENQEKCLQEFKDFVEIDKIFENIIEIYSKRVTQFFTNSGKQPKKGRSIDDFHVSIEQIIQQNTNSVFKNLKIIEQVLNLFQQQQFFNKNRSFLNFKFPMVLKQIQNLNKQNICRLQSILVQAQIQGLNLNFQQSSME